MRVLVTGGTGNVGRAAVERLVERGWEVLVIGRRTGIEISGADYAACDITHYDDLREKIGGCHAVAHLAAVANPMAAPGTELFRVNVAGTFNVFEAAAAEGITRVVQASSINAFGCAWSTIDVAVQYFPIDEDHPTFTTDPYSFSKQMVEEIGAYYWRRERISSVALRFPWVAPQSVGQSRAHGQGGRRARVAVDELVALPEKERRARVAELGNSVLEYRRQRPLEFGTAQSRGWGKETDDDLLWGIYMTDRFNFWTRVDERDSAQAIEKGLTAEYEGSHALFANADQNWLGYDAETLVQVFFPDVQERKSSLSGPVSLVSIEKAKAVIGFEPEHSVIDT